MPGGGSGGSGGQRVSEPRGAFDWSVRVNVRTEHRGSISGVQYGERLSGRSVALGRYFANILSLIFYDPNFVMSW
ncbi:hypothetical protein GCM10010320_74420 [Streptomyces caelestis]|nr:hypothetical protein GCM10010320_74420 [Streptomyces caelestis]